MTVVSLRVGYTLVNAQNLKGLEPNVTNWHFSRSFHFNFIALTLVVTVQSLISKNNLTLLVIHFVLLLCFRPSRKTKARVFDPKT